MFFLAHGILVIFYIIAIIYTCQFFTNAIEHLGSKLKLGNSAIGSILAVIGTSLPETVVPLVAIFGAILFKTNISAGENVALGAIIGSPFMLNTLALFVVGCVVFVLYLSKKREKTDLKLNYKNVLRDCKYFLVAYIPAILCTFLENNYQKYCIVLYLFIIYFVFVFRTILKSKENYTEQELDELIISKIPFLKNMKFFAIILQIFLSLLSLIVFSHLFVCEIENFSRILKISPLILSLVITPFATELPECVNSVIWTKTGKDDLAIANILGGTIFQATITMSIGILLTDWKFTYGMILNSITVISCVLLFVASIVVYKKVNFISLVLCGVFYFSYLIYMFS